MSQNGDAVTPGTEEVETQLYTFGSNDEPFVLGSGIKMPEVTLAYETYGTLNVDRSNAILVFHSLTGSQHAAGYNSGINLPGVRWTDENSIGWWDEFIGPGKALNTELFFVLCVNYLGGCYGSSGPPSISPETGEPFGGLFPQVSFADMVDAQMQLLDYLGIEKLHAVTGASTGGVMCLSLATRYPDRVSNVIPIAAGVEATALQRIMNFEQITAIQNDPAFNAGEYYGGPFPHRGLALARMISHKSFVSLNALSSRARDEVVDPSDGPGLYALTHPLESYMRHQGEKFVQRFDANSYLRFMYAWNTFDLVAEAERDNLSDLFVSSKNQRYLVFSIDSDVCFYPTQQQDLVHYLDLAGADYRWITVHSEKGHDSFLLEPALYYPYFTDMLRR